MSSRPGQLELRLRVLRRRRAASWVSKATNWAAWIVGLGALGAFAVGGLFSLR